MGQRSAEEVVRSGRFGPTLRLRVDLHGVSSFGPGKHHTLIRWEWVEKITPDAHGVVVTSANGNVVFPSGAFGLEPEALAERLGRAGSIFARAEIIAGLGSPEADA
ncbi:MAG: hypothetical protein ACYC1D_15205 [Acidimicrobiales bacterium]